MSDVRLRELERASVQGDLEASRRLEVALLRLGRPALYSLIRDEVLRDGPCAEAGLYYARMLLDLVPPRWRQRGAVVPIVQEVRYFSGTRSPGPLDRSRPSVSLNLPDGFGNPGDEPPRRDMVGVLLTATMSRRPGTNQDQAMSTGGLRIESRRNEFGALTFSPPYSFEKRTGPGWSDRSFLRAASRLYCLALEAARAVGPTWQVFARASRHVGRVAAGKGEESDWRPHVEAVHELDAESRPIGLADLPVPNQDDPMLSPADVVGWHRLLDRLERELSPS